MAGYLTSFICLFAVVLSLSQCTALVTKKDVQRARLAIRRTFTSDMENIAGYVRLAFHDCVGGCDGCINLNNADNAGLGRYIASLEKIYPAFRLKFSRVDFWMLAAITALQHAATLQVVLPGQKLASPMPTVQFRYGRWDCPTSPSTNIRRKFPDGHHGMRETAEFFRKGFGFTVKETVALLGAHTLGKARRKNSGFEGKWTENPNSLDNSFYKLIVTRPWVQLPVGESLLPLNKRPLRPPPANSKFQWVVPDDPNVNTSSRIIMLNSDVALAFDAKPHANGLVFPPELSDHGFSVGMDHVLEYATDAHIWMRDFSAVFQKTIDHCKRIGKICPYRLQNPL